MVAGFTQKEDNGIYSMHKAALLIAALSLVSQVLAVVRDKLLAHYFGAGETLSLYYAAFRIPDMVYASLSALMAAIIVLPLLTRSYTQNKDEVQNVLNSLCTVFIVVGVIVTGVLYVLMPYLTRYIVPGFPPESQTTLVEFSRLLLLSPLILGVSNLIGSVLQMKRNFLFYSLAPVLYNVGIIAGIVFLRPYFGIQGVLYGVIGGACLHLLIQAPMAYMYRLLPILTFSIDWKLIQETFFISVPRVATLLAIQIAQTFLVAQASLVALSSVAIFSLAFNIQTVPLTLIGLSYSIAAFPMLSEYVEKKNFAMVWTHIYNAMRHIIFWSIPIICFTIVLRAHIVRVLYGSGEFDWTDTRLTAAVLAVMICALTFQAFSLLIMRALYAFHSAYSQFVAQMAALLVTYIVAVYGVFAWHTMPSFAYFIEALFRISYLPDSAVLVIGLAHALGAMTLSLILLFILRAKLTAMRIRDLRGVVGQSFAAGIIGAFVAYVALTYIQVYVSLETFIGVLTSALFGVFFGFLAWFGILYILQSKELHEFSVAARKRFWKSGVVQEELQEL